jgi:hypothetical protein
MPVIVRRHPGWGVFIRIVAANVIFKTVAGTLHDPWPLRCCVRAWIQLASVGNPITGTCVGYLRQSGPVELIPVGTTLRIAIIMICTWSLIYSANGVVDRTWLIVRLCLQISADERVLAARSKTASKLLLSGTSTGQHAYNGCYRGL